MTLANGGEGGKIKIVIIGAGLGGLAAAYCFSHRGHDVELYERKPAFEPKGGAIMIRSGASRFVQQWGLGEALETVSDRSSTTVYRHSQTSEVLHERTPGNYSEYPDLGVNRSVAQKLFYENAKRAGAKMVFGKTATGLSENHDGAEVTFDDETKVEADLVLAADGITSRMRPLIIGKDAGDPILGEITAHQVELSVDIMKQHPETRSLIDTTNLTVWVGSGGYAVGRFHSKQQTYNVINGMRTNDKENPRLWDEVGDIEAVRGFFKDWNPSLRKVLDLSTSCDRWRLAETPNYPTWHSQLGRLALLGDSVHGMFPDAAQGFSTIIEDIGVLDLLLKDERVENIPEVIAAWQDIRKPRVEHIKRYAHTNHYSYANGAANFPMSSNGTAPVDEKAVVADKEAPFNTPPFNKWVYDYDGAAEIERYFCQVEQA